MAVSCHEAFGHYLRTLRERRGLAIEVQTPGQGEEAVEVGLHPGAVEAARLGEQLAFGQADRAIRRLSAG